jgi:hypothetical protein
VTLTATPVSAAAEYQNDQDDNENQFHRKAPLMVLALFASDSVLHSANGILHFARNLVGPAFIFQLLVAEDLPNSFFNCSLGLLCRAFDSIFVHCRVLLLLDYIDNSFGFVSFQSRRTDLFYLRLCTHTPPCGAANW